ncbi:AAC(3)-I family aminoglycoside N-acetyltransferase [Phenylobacterium sp.]|jgi:aminoglycoside 3-N-acetyltransferase I|uniref:AAC(3)-I family aminoglycoside N-acetyltransferase n=1 Tax=Phenylobacterium sp. TaxID=1871053 RepID=UPI002F9208D1
MDHVEIMTLGPGDIALMRGLNAMFAEAFEDPQSYGGAPPDDAYLAELLAQPHVIALAAVVGGRVVGGITAYELPKLEQARKEVYLYDLAVAEDYRRMRVATALIRRLQRIAADRGAWVVFVQADHGDDPAIALYSKLGVREEVLHFDLPVPGDG